jgi:hypothetical protein
MLRMRVSNQMRFISVFMMHYLASDALNGDEGAEAVKYRRSSRHF